MKRLITKILTVTACAVMMLAAVPATNVNTVQAASKAQGMIDLKAKKLTIPKGKTQTIKNKTVTMVQKRRYQVKSKFGSTTVTTKGTYKSSKPAIATVSSTGLVTAKAPGTTTISVTYNGTKQMFKVKVVASHTHAWKTTKKATCAAKGKKLCQKCGATGSTAKKTTHTWTTTKKATCKTAGTKKCSVCGTTASIAKTAHSWKTETWQGVAGRGKAYTYNPVYCNGCYINMTNWIRAQREAHQGDIDGILAGTSSMACYGAGTNGTVGDIRFPKYVMVKETETWCKNCKAWKDQTITDLYEVYYDDWDNVVRKSDNKIIIESPNYTAYKPYLEAQEAAKKAAASKAKAAPKTATASVATFSLMADEVPVEDIAVAEPETEIVVNGDEIAVDETEAVVPADEVLVEDVENAEDAVISGNEAVSENNISINQ